MNEKETKWRNVSELKVGEQFKTLSGAVIEVAENKRHECSDCYFDNYRCDDECPWISMVDEKRILKNKLTCMNMNGFKVLHYVRIK